METPVLPKRAYRFGLFQIDPDSGKLLRQGAARLHEQSLRVLCLLLERAGDIVTREELRQSLWPEGTYVEFEGSLNAILKRLRFALGDDADNPVFIETVPRRGYRFIAPVEREQPSVNETPAKAPGLGPSELQTAGWPAFAHLGFADMDKLGDRVGGRFSTPRTVRLAICAEEPHRVHRLPEK